MSRSVATTMHVLLKYLFTDFKYDIYKMVTCNTVCITFGTFYLSLLEGWMKEHSKLVCLLNRTLQRLQKPD